MIFVVKRDVNVRFRNRVKNLRYFKGDQFAYDDIKDCMRVEAKLADYLNRGVIEKVEQPITTKKRSFKNKKIKRA